MRHLKFVLLSLLLFFAQSICANEVYLGEDAWKDQTFLVSYPRSGNTWTRYALEFLTKRPSLRLSGLFGKNIPSHFQIETVKEPHMRWPINNWVPLGVDYTKKPIFKTHDFGHEFGKKPEVNQSKFILILRNPKENFLRGGISFERFKEKTSYFRNLYCFDRWDPSRRKLIYYEDLITRPGEIFKELLDFMGEEDSYLDEFMHDYEKHKEQSIAFYTSMGHRSITKGNSSNFHSKQVSKEERMRGDSLIQTHHPDLWKKYLSRYAEAP